MKRLQFCLVVFALLALTFSAPAWAQSSSTGTVSVTDQTGAVVAGATVSLTDVSTNIPRSTTTNSKGSYIFVDVTPGTYNVAISKAGFETTKTERQVVNVGTLLTLNLSLRLGRATEVVEVTAVGNELQTMNATVGNTVTSVAIDNLPSLGRDVSTFVTLQPGVGTDGSVAGAYQDQNYFSLDGGNNTNDLDGSGSIYTPSMTVGDPTGGVAGQYFGVSGASGVVPTPQDSVEEFKVNTSNQTADFNSSAGAEVKVVTKRGTNAWHGTGYEYYKDNNWSSNSYQNNLFDIPIPSFHYNRFGGAIGGPIIPKEILGGKTYIFFNYEGFHWPDSETINRNVPSPSLEAGNITDPVTGIVYNLATIDPEHLGLNPLVSQIWNAYEPKSNTSSCPSGQTLCDNVNVLGFSGNVSLPTTSKFAVSRLDHDFSSKEHFMASWRYYNIKSASADQVDIGGYFSGDSLGVPASVSNNPIQDVYMVAALTSNITNNTTNDVHYSWLRNWWSWSRAGGPVQNCTLCSGLGGALEIMSGEGDGAGQDLAPYNVNNQQIRTRFWDGHDQMLRDDLSTLHGNHLFQLGAMYQRNWDWHQRNDGGGFINEYPVYSLGNGTAGSGLSSDLSICSLMYTPPGGSLTPDISNCGALTAAALGIVSVANQAFSRSGPNLTLNPPLTPAFDQSTIPYYNVYFSDTWHLKPTFTLTYGLSWALEMPPTEANGKQVVMVDQSDEPIEVTSYLAARKREALAGQVYNPEIGFALTGNTANGQKYPYNPFYGQFGPRVAAAWNPHFDSDSLAGKILGHEDTVIRGGYGRQYGRLNGVTQVLIPLLGLGLIQQSQCTQNLATGCGPGAGTPSNAFRVGPTASGFSGLTAPIPVPTTTLPQPDYPGFNNSSTADASVLDPNFRPDVIDAFDLTIQRQLSRKLNLEVGYIGRRITHEFQPMAMNTVPYMMTQGGQQFKQAYANTVLQYCGGITGLGGGGCAANAGAVTPQPFFETALKGTGYCTGYSSCTAAVVANEGAAGTGNLNNAQVFSLWSDLDSGFGCPSSGCTPVNGGTGAFAFPRSMMNTPIPNSVSPIYGAGGQTSSGIQVDASTGWANYNAGFVSLKMADWRGLTAQTNFTYSKALGTGTLYQAVSSYAPFDSFDLAEEYGRQAWDQKFTFNTFFVYQPPFYKGQSGVIGRVLGGWTFATVFTAGSGTPVNLETTYGSAQEFGGADDINFTTDANALPIKPEGRYSAHYNSPSNGLPINGFKNGVADISNWRNPILGLDNRDCGSGCISGLPYWNMDFSMKKSILVTEGVNMEFQGVFANVLNHDQFLNGFSYLGNPAGWGALGGSAQEQTGGNRIIELGARVRF
jgi:hypothetical protein